MTILDHRHIANYTDSDRVWADPTNTSGMSAHDRAPFYNRCFSYYSNQAFGDLAKWAVYKDKNWLYKAHRSIYNPFRRIVEFYVGKVYPGILPMVGVEFPEGVPSAIPFSKNTDERVTTAIMQFWQWTNWQRGKDLAVRFGGMTGNTLVELIDDLDRRKVTAEIHWPGRVADILLDATGNVKYFALMFQCPILGVDGRATGEAYTYRKEVDAKTVKTYKNGKPYDYVNETEGGPMSQYNHPYGFCPAVWYKHFELGDVFGQPIMWATLGKIDELNSLASAIHDQVFKIVKSPVIVTSSGSTANLTIDANKRRQGGLNIEGAITDNSLIERKERQEVKVIRLPEGSSIMTVPLEVGPALEVMTNMISEIEHDHPELAMYEKLAEMSSLTGPGANRMLGNTGSLLYAAEAAYDGPSASLFRMAIAIAGYRVKNGDYEKNGSHLTAQHEAFIGFDLDSYANQLLNFAILPRPVIDPTELERWTTELAKATALNAKATNPGLGIPTSQLQEEAGYDEQEIAEFADAQAQAQETFGASLLSAFNAGGGQTPTDLSTNGSQGSSMAPKGNGNGIDPGAGVANGAAAGQGGSVVNPAGGKAAAVTGNSGGIGR